jgi:hypothetical protein
LLAIFSCPENSLTLSEVIVYTFFGVVSVADHCLADCKSHLAFNLLNQCEARLALNDVHNGLTMILANDDTS